MQLVLALIVIMSVATAAVLNQYRPVVRYPDFGCLVVLLAGACTSVGIAAMVAAGRREHPSPQYLYGAFALVALTLVLGLTAQRSEDLGLVNKSRRQEQMALAAAIASPLFVAAVYFDLSRLAPPVDVTVAVERDPYDWFFDVAAVIGAFATAAAAFYAARATDAAREAVAVSKATVEEAVKQTRIQGVQGLLDHVHRASTAVRTCHAALRRQFEAQWPRMAGVPATAIKGQTFVPQSIRRTLSAMDCEVLLTHNSNAWEDTVKAFDEAQRALATAAFDQYWAHRLLSLQRISELYVALTELLAGRLATGAERTLTLGLGDWFVHQQQDAVRHLIGHLRDSGLVRSSVFHEGLPGAPVGELAEPEPAWDLRHLYIVMLILLDAMDELRQQVSVEARRVSVVAATGLERHDPVVERVVLLELYDAPANDPFRTT